MNLLAQRILTLLASASVLFASVHCVCAAGSGRAVAACHPASEVAHARACCSGLRDPGRGGDHEGRAGQPRLPCDSHDGHQPGCQHCQPSLEVKAAPTLDALKVSILSFPPVPSPTWALGPSDGPACPHPSGDLPPPHDGRAVLRLHCTLLL